MLRLTSGWWCLVLILIPTLVGAQGQKTTTVITANSMMASGEKNQAIFRGNVKLVQGELHVQSDVLVVYFLDKGTGSSRPPKSEDSKGVSEQKAGKEIRYIEAKGQVHIQKGESRATCEHALYDKREEKVILRGSPVAWQEGTRISGPKMTMFLKENRSIVEGGTKVVIEGTTEDERGAFPR